MIDTLIQASLSLRAHLAEKISNIDDDILDVVPEGFDANIRWNVAHMIATPVILTYELVGESSPLVSQDFTQSAKRGTTQENFSLNEDYGKKHLSEFLVETIKQIHRDFKDLEKKEFKNSYETPTGFIVKDLESASNYILAHDGMQIGRIGAMLTVIENNA